MRLAPRRRFLALYLPYWATDFLKRADPTLKDVPLVLYERIKGGLRLAAIEPQLMKEGLRIGQNLADARAIWPNLTVLEIDRAGLTAAFESFADWHSNASPLVSILSDSAPFGDLVLDITGVSHLFGGERQMLRMVLSRLRDLGYAVSGAVAPTIGAAWAVSHFARSQVVEDADLAAVLDALPVAALRLPETQVSTFLQMGLNTIGQVRHRSRKQLKARFGSALLRIDQAFGDIEERMAPRLPAVEHHVEKRLAEPISLLDDVLMLTRDLAVQLSSLLEAQGLGAQTFHLFLYRVDHKVMTLSLNAARVTRNPHHISDLFRHRAQRLEEENYDPGFGIDMVRLAASSVEGLEAVQTGAFSVDNGLEDIDRLNDRLSSRLGSTAVLQTELIASHLPERAARLVPALVNATVQPIAAPRLNRPLRLLPMPERVGITAQVPDGLPALMVWRRETYRLVKGQGPERLGGEWWRHAVRLKLVEPPEPKKPEPGEPPKPPPYIPDLPLLDPRTATRDYFVVEDQEGRRFWVFRQGLYGAGQEIRWFLHGIFP
ncbi:Y-family DNA polymerase [Devosia sediminis]|uniref:DNA-directed DNA polymerase n=1 Tax=Devosia sediminis TaxID=2798801 RepID=A0A934J1G2_9HYPH|nr:DNA polymerase Y family protein [Devosia sediminis]MBJ3786523.1 DNA polymerase Y family protein [Devosia sediminis]